MQTLTKKELIETLDNVPDNALLIFTSNYGDRIGTMQAHPLGDVDQALLKESSYSDSGYALTDDLDHASEEFEDEVIYCLNLDEF